MQLIMGMAEFHSQVRRLHRDCARWYPARGTQDHVRSLQTPTDAIRRRKLPQPFRLGWAPRSVALRFYILGHHPHVHCVVPGGGLSSDGTRWVAARPSFFLAIKPLSRLFRRLFLERLQAAFDARMLGFYTNLTHLADRDAFAAHVQAMRRIDWVVYAKKPFGGPAQVLAYLGRYTHRVAIANSRIKALDDDHVAFNWKDYRQNGAEKIMRLKPDEFIRRFLLHTLPDGFHRIRYFGFMTNGHRAAKIASCRALLVNEGLKPENTPSSPDSSDKDAIDVGRVCPDCGGAMHIIERIFPASPRRHAPTAQFRCDTS